MISCAVIGATGYTGLELVKILLRHPHVKITGLTTRQKEAIPVRKLIPGLPQDIDLQITQYSFAEINKKADVVFLCLPHTEAMETGAQFLKAGKIVIDLSADFRIRDVKRYEKWYGVKHKAVKLLKKAVYGLPEYYRKEIAKADLIANPGCYPTSVALAIAPLLEAGTIDKNNITVDSKSGVSGAGKKLNAATQFCELDENFYAYKVGKHQHTPEIEQMLSDAAGSKVSVTFVPHLLPLDRGILSTVYLKRKKGVTPHAIRKAFEKKYANEPFVRLKPEGEFPSLKDVQYTNFCDIGVYADTASDQIIVISAIDNLLKGASGQAVQNMNIRLGFSEEEGLRTW